MKQNDASSVIPARFRTAKATLFFDRFMSFFVKFGGIGIILSVFMIFIFIFSQVMPLLQGARAEEQTAIELPAADYALIGADEWGEKPFAVERSGRVTFFDLKDPRSRLSVELPQEAQSPVTAIFYNSSRQKLLMGFENGKFMILSVFFTPRYQGDTRTIVPELKPETPLIGLNDDHENESPAAGGSVKGLSYGQSGDVQLIALIREGGAKDIIQAVRMTRQSTLYRKGDMEVEKIHDLSGRIEGRAVKILVNDSADGFLISNDRGEIYYFNAGEETTGFRQVFRPFGDLKEPEISSMDYLNGGVSVVVTNRKGMNRVFSLLVPKGEGARSFVQTKEFEPLKGPASFFDPSLRNKAFLIGEGPFVSIRYSTTETIRWEKEMPFRIQLACLGSRYDRFFLLDEHFKLHVYKFSDPHPESGWKAFFGKLWYEGYTEPSYTWQTTGSTDDFEPKFSVIPLIFGTLKGTFYALLFSLPIALLASLYTSQFAHPRFKQYVKPTMEIMASLPSVVLGFLAALWLAPLIETKIPSLLMATLFIPTAALLFGWLWNMLPLAYRRWIPYGSEWIAIIPVLFFAAWAGWSLGPGLEEMFFFIKDPETGAKIADFRLWWPEVTGTPFNQRNSLVVGFMMGFAVIPIIFTISEDALSNVPKTLISGSLALGASRWQTALRVVVPTAFPGIFSAVMIGLGRAVGETMIVVMATGNTPIMDMNIFSGMRTLSANIAVELPEAAYLSTLYRTLFLGALILFIMTFFTNTIAELVRQRFRAKYKTV